MIGRIVTVMLVVALAGLGFGGTSLAGAGTDDLALARDEDTAGVLATDGDDDDGDDGDTDDTDSFTSGVDSNDATNSRVTPVSRGDDLSRGDLTRDRTKDGPGTSTRDRSSGHTNDRSRNDTR